MAEKGQSVGLMKKDLELCRELGFRDDTTVAPVIELGYRLGYLMSLVWQHINKLRWYREVTALALKNYSWR